MSIHLGEIVELCQVEAIASKLNPNSEVRWRRFCRDYSEYFHTPYHLVLEMEPEFVISSVYEKELDDVDVMDKMEDLMDRVLSIEDPNYEAEKEKALRDFIKQAEQEEKDRLDSGEPVFVPKKNKKKEKPKEPEKELPKSGYVNLSYLEKIDKEE